MNPDPSADLTISLLWDQCFSVTKLIKTGQQKPADTEAIIQRQQRMTPECDDHCLVGFGYENAARLLRPRPQGMYSLPPAPRRDGLGIDPPLLAQLRELSLRSPHCSSNRVRSRGAFVTNWPHNAPFHSVERIRSSNRGIKHLAGAEFRASILSRWFYEEPASCSRTFQ